jgi:hypothetical protein
VHENVVGVPTWKCCWCRWKYIFVCRWKYCFVDETIVFVHENIVFVPENIVFVHENIFLCMAILFSNMKIFFVHENIVLCKRTMLLYMTWYPNDWKDTCQKNLKKCQKW